MILGYNRNTVHVMIKSDRDLPGTLRWDGIPLKTACGRHLNPKSVTLSTDLNSSPH